VSDTPLPVRDCGGCTYCCTVVGVNELNKPAGTKCDHCNVGVGCTIYEERPESCRTFHCAWVYGVGNEDARPDRSRVIFWEREGQIDGAPKIITCEVDVNRPDAIKTPAIAPIINALLRNGAVVLVRYGAVRRSILAANHDVLNRLFQSNPTFAERLRDAANE
jgi:hypothetical protein